MNTCGTQPTALTTVKLHKKYSWYPNASIVSPKCLKQSYSPSPKVFSGTRRQSLLGAAVNCNPYRRISG